MSSPPTSLCAYSRNGGKAKKSKLEWSPTRIRAFARAISTPRCDGKIIDHEISDEEEQVWVDPETMFPWIACPTIEEEDVIVVSITNVANFFQTVNAERNKACSKARLEKHKYVVFAYNVCRMWECENLNDLHRVIAKAGTIGSREETCCDGRFAGSYTST